MKKIMIVFLIIVIILVIYSLIVFKQNETQDLDSWIGNYIFTEFAPPNQNMFYMISIYKEDRNYYATISIDGFQIIQRLQAAVMGDKDHISFLFEKYLPSNISESYTRGDILLNFEKNNSDIYTSWGKIEPILKENKQKNICFKMNINITCNECN